MYPISTENFEVPPSVPHGPAPMLQWIRVTDLVVDPTYQRPILVQGRRNIESIARGFRWSCFAPVVVSPVEGGKFAIIDGQHRVTAAALIGIEQVPCQVVIAAPDEQAAAFKAINGETTPMSPLALHAAALMAGEPQAKAIAEVCACAEVEVLRYPVPTAKQAPGQTMAIGALSKCLKHYGALVLTTALQCVTQTENNRSGALSARMIKALCEVLHDSPHREKGLGLLEAFDRIDLARLEEASFLKPETGAGRRLPVLVDLIRAELDQALGWSAATDEELHSTDMAA